MHDPEVIRSERRGRIKIMRTLLIGIVMATLANAASAAETYKGYEMPPFEVVGRASGYELRAYEPHVLATVRIDGSLRSSASAGFRTLAGYIFGGNAAGQKIAMTVPVQQVPVEEGYEISFMMPGRYALEALPEPKSDDVRFERTEAARLAVSSFSGMPTNAVLRRHTAELRDALARDGLTVVGGPRYAYYDDPFTLPWRRRNEVAFVIAE
ncbi:MAG: heme-binding protein [Pseudomonadota bacterium]